VRVESGEWRVELLSRYKAFPSRGSQCGIHSAQLKSSADIKLFCNYKL